MGEVARGHGDMGERLGRGYGDENESVGTADDSVAEAEGGGGREKGKMMIFFKKINLGC